MDLKSGLPYSLIRHGLSFEYPALTESIKTDVAIIGGGISGALMAYTLIDAGIECVVLDARTIGLGSTCASTSLLQYEIDVALSDLVTKVGVQDAVRAYHLCKESIEKLGDISKQIGFADFHFSDSLYFAAHQKDIPFLKREFASRKRYGFNVEYLDREQVSSQFGFASPGAIRSHHGAHADAYCYTHRLHQFGLKKGLRVFDRTGVTKISRDAHGVKLQTNKGHVVAARHVVCATGYEVVEMIKKKIVSLQSTYATISESLEKLPDALKENIFWNTASPYFYMRATNDNRIIIGGRDEKFYNPTRRDKLIAKKSHQLQKDFLKLFPNVAFRNEFSWTGTFGSTVDGLPFIGLYPKLPNTYFALGFGGNGITFSVIAAEIVADLIQGRKNDDARIFSFERI